MFCPTTGEYLALVLIILKVASPLSGLVESNFFPSASGLYAYIPYYFGSRLVSNRITKRQINEYGLSSFRAQNNARNRPQPPYELELSPSTVAHGPDGHYQPEYDLLQNPDSYVYAAMQNRLVSNENRPPSQCCPCAPGGSSYSSQNLGTAMPIAYSSVSNPSPDFRLPLNHPIQNDLNILRYNMNNISRPNYDETINRNAPVAYPPRTVYPAPPYPGPHHTPVPAPHSTPQASQPVLYNQPSVFEARRYGPMHPYRQPYTQALAMPNRQIPPYFVQQSYSNLPPSQPRVYGARKNYGVYGYGMQPSSHHTSNELRYADDGSSIPCGYQLPPAGGHYTSTAASNSTASGSTAAALTSSATGSTSDTGSSQSSTGEPSCSDGTQALAALPLCPFDAQVAFSEKAGANMPGLFSNVSQKSCCIL